MNFGLPGEKLQIVGWNGLLDSSECWVVSEETERFLEIMALYAIYYQI